MSFSSLSKLYDPVPQPTCSEDWLATHKEKGQSVVEWNAYDMLSRRVGCIGWCHKGVMLVTIGLKGNKSDIWIAELIELTAALIGAPPNAIEWIQHFALGKGKRAKGPKNEHEFYEYIPLLNVKNNDIAEQVVAEAKDTLKAKASSQPSTNRHGKRKNKSATLESTNIGEVCARVSHSNGNRQLRCSDIKEAFRSVPAFKDKKILILTDEDLFEEDSDLFVAGLAWSVYGVGVFSLLRYNQSFSYLSNDYWYQYCCATLSSNVESDLVELLRRSARLFSHELLHLFGFNHCVAFRCLMNGSGHIAEDIRQPLLLCPIDLEKVMQLKLNYSKLQDYLMNLSNVLERLGLVSELQIVKKIFSTVSCQSD